MIEGNETSGAWFFVVLAVISSPAWLALVAIFLARIA